MKIRPKNWRDFQHYKNRRPPWIRLHRSLLDNREFISLPTASKALAPLLWLLASESMDGEIDATPQNLGFRLRMTDKEVNAAIRPLMDNGFFEVVKTSASKPLASGQQVAPESCSETETETETETEESREEIHVPQSGTVRAIKPPEDVQRVFDHWRATHNHPRSSLDLKRTKIVRDALKLYSEADLCQSITGYLNSPHHMGQNDRNTRYDSIELLLSDARRIDNGLVFYANPPRTDLSAKTLKVIAQTENWIPPEARHAGN